MSLTVTKQDGSLGLVTPGATKPLVIGPASGGTKETVYTFGQTNQVKSTVGHGPGQVAAECILQINGGSVDFMVASASIAGTTTTPVSSSGAPAMTLSGTPYNTYDFTGTVVQGGALDEARWKFTLDGVTDSPEQPLVGDYTLQNTGLSLEFASGTYVAGQTYTFTSTAPRMNSTDVQTCMQNFTGSTSTPTVVLIANDTTDLDEAKALFNTVDTNLVAWDALEKFSQAVVPTGGAEGVPGATKIAWANTVVTTGNTITAVAEKARRTVPSPFQGYANPKIPFAQAMGERVQGNLISTPSDRYADGKLTGWSEPTYDEYVNGSTYKEANIVAPRTYAGDGGVFLATSKNKANIGTDYKFFEWGRTLNRAVEVAARAVRRYLSSIARVKTDGSGQIVDADKSAIESYVLGQLDAALLKVTNVEGTPGHVSGVGFTINGETNLLATGVLECSVAIIPLAKIETITLTAGFTSEL